MTPKMQNSGGSRGQNAPGGGKGMGRGRGRGLGPGGNCTCPQCGHKVVHQRGVPCLDVQCPQCGAQMMPER